MPSLDNHERRLREIEAHLDHAIRDRNRVYAALGPPNGHPVLVANPFEGAADALLVPPARVRAPTWPQAMRTDAASRAAPAFLRGATDHTAAEDVLRRIRAARAANTAGE